MSRIGDISVCRRRCPLCSKVEWDLRSDIVLKEADTGLPFRT
jgi:hypothetical protein